MNRITEIFNWPRFVRVLVNDLLLLQARRIAFASLGLAGIGTLIYVTNVTEVPQANMELPLGVFLFLLIGGGQIFTSMIFNDMHHPLERFHYLTLPCSNLERFVSRYLITAPLYVVYAIVLFKVFEVFANLVCSLLWYGETIPVLDFGLLDVRLGILGYFISHVFVFTGAIWFRSYSLIKTMVASFAFWTACGIVTFLAVRIIYWDHFISFFEMDPNGVYLNMELPLNEDGSPLLWEKVLFGAFLLWVMFLAFLGLKEHEVQDGL